MISTIRIFVSSPNDVAEERQIVGKVIAQLQGKYWSFVRLEDVFWETATVRATAHFQDEIIHPGDCDIVLGILWSTLGSPLPAKFNDLDDLPRTGTEWELEEAFAANEKSGSRLPEILIYRRNSGRPTYDDPQEEARSKEQWERLEQYFDRFYFHDDKDRTIKRSVRNYPDLVAFESLVRANLESLILARIPELKAGDVPPPISGCPFKDLRVFDFQDQDRFFGRNRQIREIQLQLRQRRSEGCAFVLIYGGSGYGKSSLMRAGVAPVVCRPGGVDDESGNWRRVMMIPSEGTGSLVERLARAILGAPSEFDQLQHESAPSFPLSGVEEFAQEPIMRGPHAHIGGGEKEKWDIAHLTRVLSDPEDYILAVTALNDWLEKSEIHLLVQVDQLEEALREPFDRADQEALFRSMGAMFRCPRIWGVATMRNEFFPEVSKLPSLKNLVGRTGGYILSPPDAQMLHEVIQYPAMAARLEFENRIGSIEIDGEFAAADSLDSQIFMDAKDSPEALPLLEFCLTKLYEDTLPEPERAPGQNIDLELPRERDLLRWERYAEIGGLKGAIAAAADEVIQKLRPTQWTDLVESKLFSSLVRVDAKTGEATRKRAVLEELESITELKAVAGPLLESRLLVSEAAGSGHGSVIFLAHDCLLTHWKMLSDWVSRNQATLAAFQRLEEQAELWDKQGRSNKLLLSEGLLAEASSVVNSEACLTSETQLALVRYSQLRANWKKWLLIAAVIVFAVLAMAATHLSRLAKNREIEAAENATRAEEGEKAARQQLAYTEEKIEEAAEKAWEEARSLSQSDERGDRGKALARYAEAWRYNNSLPSGKQLKGLAADTAWALRWTPAVNGTPAFSPVEIDDINFFEFDMADPEKIAVAHGSNLLSIRDIRRSAENLGEFSLDGRPFMVRMDSSQSRIWFTTRASLSYSLRSSRPYSEHAVGTVDLSQGQPSASMIPGLSGFDSAILIPDIENPETGERKFSRSIVTVDETRRFLRVWGLENAEVEAQLNLPGEHILSIGMDPSGEVVKLVLGMRPSERRVVLFKRSTGEILMESSQFPEGEYLWWDLSLSHGGRFLSWTNGKRELFLINTESGEKNSNVVVAKGNILRSKFSQDSRFIIIQTESSLESYSISFQQGGNVQLDLIGTLSGVDQDASFGFLSGGEAIWVDADRSVSVYSVFLPQTIIGPVSSGEEILSLRTASKSRLLLMGLQNRIRSMNLQVGDPIGARPVYKTDLEDDGVRLSVDEEKNSVTVFDHTGTGTRFENSHGWKPEIIRRSPDGSLLGFVLKGPLVSDNNVMVARIPGGETVFDLKGVNRIQAMEFWSSGDGLDIQWASGGANGYRFDSEIQEEEVFHLGEEGTDRPRELYPNEIRTSRRSGNGSQDDEMILKKEEVEGEVIQRQIDGIWENLVAFETVVYERTGDTLKRLYALPNSHDVQVATVSSNGKYIFTGDSFGRLSLWNAESGDLILSENLGSEVVSAVAVNDSNEIAIAGTHGGEFFLIDLNSGRRMAAPISAAVSIMHVGFSQDENGDYAYFDILGNRRSIVPLDFLEIPGFSGREIEMLAGVRVDDTNSIIVIPDGERISYLENLARIAEPTWGERCVLTRCRRESQQLLFGGKTSPRELLRAIAFEAAFRCYDNPGRRERFVFMQRIDFAHPLTRLIGYLVHGGREISSDQVDAILQTIEEEHPDKDLIEEIARFILE